MHLGLARAQLLPRSDGYRRFTGSPIDALVYLVGLSCQIPIRLALRTIIHRRVAALPQRWPACRGDVRGGQTPARILIGGRLKGFDFLSRPVGRAQSASWRPADPPGSE
jgi:hypothetical protein